MLLGDWSDVLVPAMAEGALAVHLTIVHHRLKCMAAPCSCAESVAPMSASKLSKGIIMLVASLYLHEATNGKDARTRHQTRSNVLNHCIALHCPALPCQPFNSLLAFCMLQKSLDFLRSLKVIFLMNAS